MEILTINLGANENKSFRKAGAYLEILASIGPIGVTFNSTSGGQTNSINGGVSGLFLDADFGAFTVQDQSGAAQQVQLLVCDPGETGGSRRQPGNVRVIDEITDAITYGFPAPTTALQAYGATAIVAPATNVNGIVVRQASANTTSGAGGTSYAGIIACKSPPTGYQAPLQRYTLADAYSSGQQNVTTSFNLNKFLPPGWGLYCVKEVLSVAAGTINATVAYEVK